jgi:diguanylate cyclase (GGDEF)-like protein
VISRAHRSVGDGRSSARKRAETPGAFERWLASYSGAGLFAAGAVIDVAVTLSRASDEGRTAALLIAAFALLGGAAMVALERAGRTSLTLIYLFNLAAVALVAVLVACTGGPSSPYPGFYLFAIVHTAAFQPRRRVAALVALVIVLLLAPAIYDPDPGSATFDALALAAVPGVIVVAAALTLAAEVIRKQQSALRDLTLLDGLTGVGNYRMFWLALDAESARARRRGDPFSLILLDLDGFKPVNDELGHVAGDEALRRVAEVLRDAVRGEDVVCRHGGDEFSVIAAGAGPGEAAELAHRLCDAVAQRVELPGGRRLTSSAGWATCSRDEPSPADIHRRADDALLRAKRPPRTVARLGLSTITALAASD